MRYSPYAVYVFYEHSAYETGLGLVYPLLYDYPNDENLANYSDAWMFGDYLLVAQLQNVVRVVSGFIFRKVAGLITTAVRCMRVDNIFRIL